jgi:hypothetical protein
MKSKQGDRVDGEYVNYMEVKHNSETFVMEFAMSYGKDDTELGSCLLASPGFAKRMLQTLQTNVAKYESKYGEIKTPAGTPPIQIRGDSASTV